MINRDITKLAHLIVILFLLLSPVLGLPQPLPCGSDTLITSLALEFFGDDISRDEAIEISIEGSEPIWALPQGNYQWKAQLRASMLFKQCRPMPVRKGFIAIQVGASRFFINNENECVGHFIFRFDKVWQIEVDSKPRNIKVESDLFDHGYMLTRFKTPLLRWEDELRLKIFCSEKDNYPFELDVRKMNEKKEIIHDRKQIIELLTSKRTKRPNSFFSMLKNAKANELTIEEVLFRLTIP